MIVCPVCQHRNPEGAKTCEACGASLEGFFYRVCPVCGALNPAEAVFCRRCLAELIPSEAPEEPLPPTEAEAPSEETASIAPPTGQEEPPETTEEEITEEPSVEEVLPKPEHPPVPVPNPLEGLEELLPLEAAVALPHRAEPRQVHFPDETERRDAELFQQIATEPAPLREQARVLGTPRTRALSPIGRLILYILVLLIAIVPYFSGGFTASWITPREDVTSLLQSLNSLPQGATVLLAFDYDPAYAGEMNPLALDITRQLAQRSVHIVALSTQPAGIGLAEQVLRQLSDQVPAYRYGQSYAILGYLPGQEAGLRTLNSSLGDAFKEDYLQRRSLGELPVTRGLATLADFEQIILFADDETTVRRWIEQIQSRNPEIPLHALVTARIAPMLVPYRQSGQLSTLLPGTPGAIELEAAMGRRSFLTWTSDAYTALFFSLLFIAVISNVLYLSSTRRVR